MITDRDMRTFVERTLVGAEPGEFDVDAIVDELHKVFGLVDLESIEGRQYWGIVFRHRYVFVGTEQPDDIVDVEYHEDGSETHHEPIKVGDVVLYEGRRWNVSSVRGSGWLYLWKMAGAAHIETSAMMSEVQRITKD